MSSVLLIYHEKQDKGRYAGLHTGLFYINKRGSNQNAVGAVGKNQLCQIEIEHIYRWHTLLANEN